MSGLGLSRVKSTLSLLCLVIATARVKEAIKQADEQKEGNYYGSES
jgi:hypothetical protein